MSFRRYGSYRESGVEWLGDVPTPWPVQPLKTVAGFTNGEAFKPSEWSDAGTPIIRIQNLNGGDEFNFYEGSVDPRYHVHSGDLLFGWSGNRGTSFGPFKWSREGLHYLNQHIFKVDPGAAHPGWLYWCLKAVTQYVERQAHGIIGMVHVTQGKLGAVAVPLPSQREQEAVAAFLDRETAKIDALVEEQRRLIELLKEKRQAVISHAVTKGLDPSSPMKDSGVEWLGEVPAHWRLRPLKHVARFQSGGTPSKERPDLWDGDVPWASAKDLKVDVLDDTADHISAAAVEDGLAQLVPANSVVVLVRGMMLARTFPVVLTSAPMAINQDLKALMPLEGLRADFLAWSLRASTAETLGRLDEAGHGTKALRMEAWASLAVPLPPAPEQEAIASHIVSATARLDDLAAQADAAIALLTERRAALISAAVTGKVDVREPAAVPAELELA